MWDDMYTDKLTVSVYGPVKDETTGITEQKESVILENVYCYISSQSKDKNGKSIDINEKTAVIKIFLNQSYNISKGSKVKATKYINGVARTVYEGNCGEPVLYSDHQEFILENEGVA